VFTFVNGARGDVSRISGGLHAPAARERHGNLAVVGVERFESRGGYNCAFWRCRCDCGRECVVQGGRFRLRRRCPACGDEARRSHEGDRKSLTHELK
jgi:hypothetical protein